MDVTSFCYETDVRWYNDAPTSTIKWIFAAEGAPVYAGENVFYNKNFVRHPRPQNKVAGQSQYSRLNPIPSEVADGWGATVIGTPDDFAGKGTDPYVGGQCPWLLLGIDYDDKTFDHTPAIELCFDAGMPRTYSATIDIGAVYLPTIIRTYTTDADLVLDIDVAPEMVREFLGTADLVLDIEDGSHFVTYPRIFGDLVLGVDALPECDGCGGGGGGTTCGCPDPVPLCFSVTISGTSGGDPSCNVDGTYTLSKYGHACWWVWNWFEDDPGVWGILLVYDPAHSQWIIEFGEHGSLEEKYTYFIPVADFSCSGPSTAWTSTFGSTCPTAGVSITTTPITCP
jgi:hypothetical protein